MIGACGLLIFPLLQPFLKDSYPVLNIFRVSAADWRLWVLLALSIAAAGIIWKGLKLVKEKRHLTACHFVAIGFLIMAGIGQIYYIPYIDPVKSARRASKTIRRLLPQEGTLAFYRRRFDNGWNFYLDRKKIPIITDKQIRQEQPRYDMIILREKHMNLIKSVLNMDNYRIAAVEPVGSKRFVLLKYDGAGKRQSRP
jgi:hypothetical protein